MSIKLIAPQQRYAEQVMEYRAQMLANGDSLDGCARLEECDSFAQWVDFSGRLQILYGSGYVPETVYLAVRESDDRLVGIIDLRYPLSEYLLNYGGHIGYSVRPDERRKGYAKAMLNGMLKIAKAEGLDKVLVVCDKSNVGSRKTILANDGKLENEIVQNDGNRVMQRYWIGLAGSDDKTD